jgi:hypothetical protein
LRQLKLFQNLKHFLHRRGQDEVGEAPTVAGVVPDDMDVLGAADVVKHVGCFFLGVSHVYVYSGFLCKALGSILLANTFSDCGVAQR